jgi:hypothetical protein
VDLRGDAIVVDFDIRLEKMDGMTCLEVESKIIFCTSLKGMQIRRKELRRKEEVENPTDVGIRK